MPHALLEQLKPAARARTRLLAAAMLWSVVGTGLAVAGFRWCLASEWPGAAVLLASAGLLGVAKARFALARVARRNAERILERGDDRCLGGFVSWRSWLFILAMMASGYLLRRSPVPLPILGLLYAAVGIALLVASTILWRSWHAAGQLGR